MSDDRFHRYHRDGTSSSSSSSSTSSSHEDDATTNVNVVRAELSKLRTDLYDMLECDANMRLLLEKVKQLTEFENVALVERGNEIRRLREELRVMRTMVDDDDGGRGRGGGMKTTTIDARGVGGGGGPGSSSSSSSGANSATEASTRDGGIGGDVSCMPSFDSITMASSSSDSTEIDIDDDTSSVGCRTNESERDTSYMLFANRGLARKVAGGTSPSSRGRTPLHPPSDVESTGTTTATTAREGEEHEDDDGVVLPRDGDVETMNYCTMCQNQIVSSKVWHDQIRGEEEEDGEGTIGAKIGKGSSSSSSSLSSEREEVKKKEEWGQKKEKEQEMETMMTMMSKRDDIEHEIRVLENVKRELIVERNRLLQEVEVYSHQCELAILLEEKMNQNDELRMAINELNERSARDAETITKLEYEVRRLVEAAAAAGGADGSSRRRTTTTTTTMTTISDDVASRMEDEDDARATPRSSRKRSMCEGGWDRGGDERNRRTVVDVRRSDGDGDEDNEIESDDNDDDNDDLIEGAVEEEMADRRERSFTGGSDTVSALHEEVDGHSILFDERDLHVPSSSFEGGGRGGDGIPRDVASSSSIGNKNATLVERDCIRAHAERVLYWANRVTERSKGGGSRAGGGGARSSVTSLTSVTSKEADHVLARGDEGPPPAKQPKSSSPIPTTIGLPPRSQSRVRVSSSRLPPRCPPVQPSAVVPSSSSSLSKMTSISPPSSPSSSSDKENGGDVAGAFPRFQQRRGNRNRVSVSTDQGDVMLKLHLKLEDGGGGMLVGGESSPMLCCECTASPFSGNDPQSEFYLPKLGLACSCGRGGDADTDRANFSLDPTALSNILRPWQCDFLSTAAEVTTADALLRAHKADANGMARRMRDWRAANADISSTTGGEGMRSRECYVALKIWSHTCKVVLRSIREQRERARREGRDGAGMGGGDGDYDEGRVIIEKPQFLDISFADAHTIASISTLGQFSSVCGAGRPFEMMEI